MREFTRRQGGTRNAALPRFVFGA